MNKTDQRQALLSRAERLFAKKSYAAAKKEFERAVGMAPNETPDKTQDKTIQEKIRICEEQLALDRRREQIKKARRLEKKGGLANALECFTAACAVQAEPWLADKIAQLQRQLATEEAGRAVEETSGEEDPSVRLAVYDAALAQAQTQTQAQAPDPAILEKKAGCLVEMGRYEEALAVYLAVYGERGERAASGPVPLSVQGRCDFGHALMAQGRYREGLAQWEPLLSHYPALFPHVTAILPYLARELAGEGAGYALPRRVLAIIVDEDQGASRESLQHYARYFDYCYLKELWHAGNYAEVLEFLPSPPRLRDAPLLAKLYLGLSEANMDYLEPAITYWLTAIYNQDALRALRVHQATPELPHDEALRHGLLGLLEAQINVYARSNRLPPAVKAHWEAERRGIAHLAALPVGPGELSLSSEDAERFFPCTPAFARTFGLSDGILRLIQEKKDGFPLDGRDWLDLYADYSSLGQYMAWIEPGSEEKVFNSLSAKGSATKGSAKDLDPETEYLRQRIAFRCGISRVRAGGRHSRKYFQAALPLLETGTSLRQELIGLVYADSTPDNVISSLSEAMELLARRLDDPAFREAAAHCIGLDVENLLHNGVSPAAVEKRLAAGLAIDPDCHQIQTTLQAVRREQDLRRVSKALRAGNLNKAARIVSESEDDAMEGLFFSAMENAHEQLRLDADAEWVPTRMRELYEACRIVDEEHWLTWNLEEKLSERGIL